MVEISIRKLQRELAAANQRVRDLENMIHAIEHPLKVRIGDLEQALVVENRNIVARDQQIARMRSTIGTLQVMVQAVLDVAAVQANQGPGSTPLHTYFTRDVIR